MENENYFPYRMTQWLPDMNYPRLVHFKTRAAAMAEFTGVTEGDTLSATLDELRDAPETDLGYVITRTWHYSTNSDV